MTMEAEQLPVGNVTNPTQNETPKVSDKMSQKDAVLLFTKEVLGLNSGAVLTEGATLKSSLLAESEDTEDSLKNKKALRKAVRALLFDAFKAGKVKISCEKTDPQLRKYCSGLINNWLKKDPRFS